MNERPHLDLRIDTDRLIGRLSDLAEIGEIPGTAGCSRLAFTDADKLGRDLVVTWMEDLGLTVTIDVIGNVIGIWAPEGTDASLAPVMTGSHIDTVATGGRYDGNLGVLAGLEVIETLASAGFVPSRPLAVSFFSNEEGARFPPDMMGSLVYVGGMGVEEAYSTKAQPAKGQSDSAETTVGSELARIGYQGSAPCPGLVPYRFVELHIEQGPVLEEEGVTIGAVTSVQGISWTEVTIDGQSNHAGTTPMRLRHDAGYAAARVATFVRQVATELDDEQHPQVGTVGSMRFHPNLVNVVAAQAVLTVDLRNTDPDVLETAERRLAMELDTIEAEEGVSISTRSLARFDPVTFDPGVVDLVERTAKDLGLSTMRLPSGAGHDAQMLARICPSAMIFTPSHRGLSHNPAEHTDTADLEAGANVLLQVMLALAVDESP